MIIVLMGVSGSGKTTVGKALAQLLGWCFLDADDYQPAANIEKLRRGIPLSDDDRRPWLETQRRLIREARGRGEYIVLACSALKHAYQDYLQDHAPEIVKLVYLRGSEELIHQRLSSRTDHFMNRSLLRSQFETLEPPEHALQIEVDSKPDEIVASIQRELGLSALSPNDPPN